MPRPWAVILAGGDGARLQGVTTALTGEPTPKQFCRLLSQRTLLDDTRQRLHGLADDRRTVVLVSSPHRRFYEGLQRDRPPELLAEQPANNGTAVGMAFALGRIRRGDRDPIVAFFPSDHHYANDGAFREAVAAAYRIAASNRGRLVLVGATPHAPEPDYGWIEPGGALEPSDADHAAYAVNRFWEKPDAPVAVRLFRNRCLWNTFITVGTLEAYCGAFAATEPGLAAVVDAVAAVPAADEARVVDGVYQQLPKLCFSSRVLAASPERCVVVPLHASGWIDIGRPDRLAGVRTLDARSA